MRTFVVVVTRDASRKHRPGAVSEDDARGAVLVVDDAAHHVGADDEDTRSWAPLAMNCEPTVNEYTNPQHAAERSNPHARDAFSLSCTRHAVDGNIMSGVTVPTMMRSMSSALMPRRSSASCAAAAASSEVPVPFLGDAALADAGALEDPLIGRVDEGFEIVVAENLLGEESTNQT